MELDKQILQQAADQARGLAMDAVEACSSGHLGLPLGAAEMGAALYGELLHHNPDQPRWLNRDRFVLSAGHGSMFLYSWLNLSGYQLSMEELRHFRQLHSKTPGHPEFGETEGVEATTGPLGQGVGNAVGMAVSGKMAGAHFNTAEHPIFDYHVVALAGDGCLQEGIAAEASAFAGHFGLDNLILIYDSNKVTLDAMAEVTQSEDTAERYRAYGFDVYDVDGHDLEAFAEVFERAKAEDNGKPKLIVAHTLIAKGIPEVAGTNKGHGEAGVKYVAEARKALGLPEEKFYVSEEVRAYFAQHKEKLVGDYTAWEKRYEAWRQANPEKAASLETALKGGETDQLLEKIPTWSDSEDVATRKAGSDVLQPLAQALPQLVSGSADLHGSTLNYIQDGENFTRDNPGGRNLHFGIREHAMGAICNGLAYDGIFRASGATFLVFSDYLRPSIRLAALSHLPVVYIFTHDSPGVGEDGPTHQPVETVSALRVIPNLDVIRPADPEETAGAFVGALQRTDGPTALILTRQKIPVLNSIEVDQRRQGALHGGYIARKESSELSLILLATGSELHLALAAAEELGDGVRVVSLPCMERFDRQSAEYREGVLPSSCRSRIAIEAGVSGLWHKYLGLEGKTVCIDRFGLSAPGGVALKELGISKDHVLEVARGLLNR